MTDRFRGELVDCLTKVAPWDAPPALNTPLMGVAGQRVCFQVAWLDTSPGLDDTHLKLEVASDASVDVSQVRLVPVQIPSFTPDSAANIADQAGLYPDLLELLSPTDSDGRCYDIVRQHTGWHSIWIRVGLPATSVRVRLSDPSREKNIIDAELPITTVGGCLPETTATITTWFHCDSLAHVYQTDVWGEKHWRVIEQFLEAARYTGFNSVMMPLWTPPVDTAPCHYRTPTQLLEITRTGDGHYQFGTRRADRWIDLMRRMGYSSVEVPHLFTQWGAKFAPQFWVDCGSGPEPMFGWGTNAQDREYRFFLTELVPFVRKFLDDAFGTDHVFFHISDEPNQSTHESYELAEKLVRSLLEGSHILDAVSDPLFASAVETPVVATNAVRAFRQSGVTPTWVYYCVAQDRRVANRFIAQRGIRHRMIGWHMYKFQVKGFLHWALNFYNAALSVRPIHPFIDTSAGGSLISGDAFILYPGAHGEPLGSLRSEMLRDAFEDLALCELAERHIGRKRVLDIIDPDGSIDFDAGWPSASEYLERRATLLRALLHA